MSVEAPGSTAAQRLEAFLAAQPEGGEPRVVGLDRVGVGRSRENWFFDLVTGGASESLILRQDPDGGLVDTDRGTEFAVLRALEGSALPVPRARWLDASGTWLGTPFLIMRRVDGTCDYRVLNGDRPLAERRALAERFCELIADVHRTDWRALGLDEALTDPGPDAALAELARWEAILRSDALEPYPELELAIDALRATAPTSRRTALVHADFKPGNILLAGSEVAALLDWELAHLGDPLEDLGWVTQPLRAVEHTIEGAWEATDLVAHYERVTGEPVDPAALRWWVVFSTFKTAVMQVSGLRSFLEGRSDEPYRPTRRVLAELLGAIATPATAGEDR